MKINEHLRHAWLSPAMTLTVLAAASSATYIPPAVAAETLLEEVLVTARRRAENEQTVPIAMQVMSEEFLRTQSVGQIEDIGTKVPSLRISGAGGSLNEPLISLRGQRPAESSFAQDQAVPMYVNDVAISPTQGSNLALYDLQSLQVLKGPQGTLFGRNSTGGAILMTSKRPGTELGCYAEVKVGDYNLLGFEGAVDVPVNENLQMRLAAHKLDRDGYQKNVANNPLRGEEFHDEHSQGFRLSVAFAQNQFDNILVLSLDENDIAAAMPITMAVNSSVGLGAYAPLAGWGQWVEGVQRNIARNNPWKIETDVKAKEYVKNIFVSNATTFELTENLSIKNIIGYRQIDFDTATDIDGTAFPGFGTWTNGAPGVTTNTRPTTLDSEFFSDELQLLGSAMKDKLDWIVGLYWSEVDATQDYLVQTSPGPSFDSGITQAINTSYGIFGEGSYAVTEAWSATLGIRQSWDDRELTVSKWRDLARTMCNVTGAGGAAIPDCSRSVDEKFNSPTWRASLNHTSAAGHLVYGSISTGYRAGGFNTRGNSDATLKPFDEEVVTTYELGHKGDWETVAGTLRTNAALYWQDYQDIQYTRSFDQGGSTVTRTENAAEAEIKGIELEATLAPTENLILTAGLSFVAAKFKERLDLIGGVEVDTSGNDFVYTPERTVSASATYTLPVAASLGEISVTASVYWQDDMSTHALIDQFPILPAAFGGNWSQADIDAMTEYSNVSSYEVWNTRVDWRNVMASKVDAALYLNNASDETYVLGGLNVVDSGGYGANTYGAPRTIGASLRYNF